MDTSVQGRSGDARDYSGLKRPGLAYQGVSPTTLNHVLASPLTLPAQKGGINIVWDRHPGQQHHFHLTKSEMHSFKQLGITPSPRFLAVTGDLG